MSPAKTAELRGAESDQRHEQGQAEHDHHTENRRKRDGSRHIVAVRADHRGYGGDCRVAADGIPAGDQDRHALGKAETATDREAGQNHGRDHARDPEQQARPDIGQRAERDARAEKHDGHFEQRLGREGDAAVPARTGRPERADRRPDNDSQHQSFEPGAAEQTLFHGLDSEGRERYKPA